MRESGGERGRLLETSSPAAQTPSRLWITPITQLPAELQPVTGHALADQEEEDCSFLDSVRCFLVGCTPGEEAQAVQIARQGGATRLMALSPILTHIIVRPIVYSAQAWQLRHCSSWLCPASRLSVIYRCLPMQSTQPLQPQEADRPSLSSGWPKVTHHHDHMIFSEFTIPTTPL